MSDDGRAVAALPGSDACFLRKCKDEGPSTFARVLVVSADAGGVREA